MNSYKILVVEDEKNICNFMKMIFETNDYQVIFAQNGKKFFDLLSYQKNVIIKEQQNCNQRRTYENVSN